MSTPTTLRTAYLTYHTYQQPSGKPIEGWFFLQGGTMGLRSLRYGIDEPIPVLVTTVPRSSRGLAPVHKVYAARIVAVQAYKSQVIFEGDAPDTKESVQVHLDARHLRIDPLRIRFIAPQATDLQTPSPLLDSRSPTRSSIPALLDPEALLHNPAYAAFAPFLQFVQDETHESVLRVREGHYELTMPVEIRPGVKQETTVIRMPIGYTETVQRLFEYLQHIAEWESMRSCLPDYMPPALCFVGNSNQPTFSLKAQVQRSVLQSSPSFEEEGDFEGLPQQPRRVMSMQEYEIPASGIVWNAVQDPLSQEPFVSAKLLLTNHGSKPIYATLLLFDCEFGSLVLHNSGRCHLEPGETEDIGLNALKFTIPTHLSHLESVCYYAKIVVSDIPAHCPPGVFDSPLPAPGPKQLQPIPPPVTVRCIDSTGFDYSDWASFLFPIIIKNPNYRPQ